MTRQKKILNDDGRPTHTSAQLATTTNSTNSMCYRSSILSPILVSLLVIAVSEKLNDQNDYTNTGVMGHGVQFV